MNKNSNLSSNNISRTTIDSVNNSDSGVAAELARRDPQDISTTAVNYNNEATGSSNNNSIISPDEFTNHVSCIQSSYLAAVSRLSTYEETIAEQQKQLTSLELKLQSSQGQNLKLVQEVIKLSRGEGSSSASYSLEDNVAVADNAVSNNNSTKQPNSADTMDQLQGELQQLQSEMATVLLKEKQEMCLELLEAGGDIKTLLAIFTTHIGGFGAKDSAPSSAVWKWRHVSERWIPAICNMMIQCNDEPLVQEEACQMLISFCQIPTETSHAASAANSSNSISSITADEDSAISTADTYLEIQSERQNAIRTHRGIYAIVSAMTHHRYNPNVQTLACKTLRIVCHQNATNRDVVGQERGVQAIVAAMKDHIRSSFVVSEACMTLAMLCFENTQNKNSVRESDGITAIVACMTAPEHEQDAAVHEKACLALYKCCFENPANRVAIHDVGGIPPIIYAMKQFPNNAEVQIQAMGAIMNLSHQNNVNKIAAKEAGAFEAIVSAMAKFPSEVMVQKHACCSLNNLIADTSAKARMVELKPERLLASACRNFPKECGALARSILNKLG
mmetsp:Transcript_4248/g.6282  ORF Transcript_4248/g.6282 Transcript_4248/m.6282 type:complete len:561 (-) Transcript_4248:627-2309(-)|eukprot:CAMPEP_0172431828 /NCGR_PEP_ID=MMETSP1064-20121228/60163_1 /TAXON_ID=202472 /ORGANISM="Aulacoseira subarctica , Strain CCAP 1002/5" /LENGTH=560 /DNA_ID=CAMNT_0013178743 /DNA_START=36 /DNA_END=1718 /DNA_ORIENTATION=+